jgi:hypothetical protein
VKKRQICGVDVMIITVRNALLLYECAATWDMNLPGFDFALIAHWAILELLLT